MKLKLLQLNIFQGILFDNVIEFIKTNDIDILHLQEVTSGAMSQGGKYRYPRTMKESKSDINDELVGVNCFEELKKTLDMDGILLNTSSYINDPGSSSGNATLYKKKIKLLNKDVVWLKDFFEIPEDFTDLPALSRGAIISSFLADSKEFTTINTHLTWGPNSEDEQYKIDQAKKLYDRVKEIKTPFVLTGDFNVTPTTKTASMFNSLAKNLVIENEVTNTLDGTVHPAKQLFPPGLAVDYIFVIQRDKGHFF